ncbi:MAG TPA: DUF1634 domain-containing protein [bacterium]|nr:DUF1634 domain-containing protein [bacterium]
MKTRPDLQDLSGDSGLRPMVSAVLRYGVLLAAVVIVIGLVLSVIQVGFKTFVSMPRVRVPEVSTDLTSLRAVFRELLPPIPEGLMDAGVLLLIATPVLTVGASTIMFAVERDWLYVAISGFVFVVLILGFVLGGRGALGGS